MSSDRRAKANRIGAGVVAACVLTLVTSSVSGAATPPRYVGEVFVPTGGCNDVTELQTAMPGNQHRVPGRGVITSMRTVLGSGATTTITFKVARAGSTADTWRAVGSSRAIAVTPNSVVRASMRIPTRAGDVLGVYFPTGTCLRTNTINHQISQLSGELSNAEAALVPFDGYQVPIEGIWEPDADRDAYGDRSQDGCPTDPTTHGSCATSRPRTEIRSIAVAPNRDVRVQFGANEPSTFRCAVDSPVYQSCRSPFERRLAPGQHTIAVVAIDRYGNQDASPAIARVRVPR